jgi:hypothetical protein
MNRLMRGLGDGGTDAGRISEIEHRAGWRNLLRRPADRLFLLKTTVIVAFCAGLLMCPALWIGPRSYPMAPVSSLLPPIEGVVAAGLYGCLFLLAALAVVLPRPGRCVAGFLAIVAVFCLTDQTRWQPRVFQYGFLLGIVALTPRAGSGQEDDARALDIARLIVALTYVFSGLQKINLNFMENDIPWIVSPITGLLPSASGLLGAFGFVVPFIQVAFGIAGLNWNNVIWPWTAAMAAFDVLLFSQASDFSWRKAAMGRDPGYLAAIMLFALLPLLSFFNLWDSYLSSALYSGNLTEAQIYLSDIGAASLAPAIKSRLVHTSPDTNVLNIQRWAMEDLNVTPYSETRVFKAVAKGVCSGVRDPSQLVLIVREQRMFFSRPETGYRCAEL